MPPDGSSRLRIMGSVLRSLLAFVREMGRGLGPLAALPPDDLGSPGPDHRTAILASAAARARCYPVGMVVPASRLGHLPGGDLAEAGLRDLDHGIESPAALLVSSFAERLRRAGLDVPALRIDDPEHRLYLLLAAEDAEAAHSRYNSLVRRLVSFARALECAS